MILPRLEEIVRRRVTLSFDNGPDDQATPQVLAELRRRQLSTTFFVVGTALARPGAFDLARRARDEGHWIGNHTLNHGTPLGDRDSPVAVIDEIAMAQKRIGALSHPEKFFRPNGGKGRLGPHLLSRAAIAHLEAERYTVVTWNVVPRDWEAPVDSWISRALAEIDRRDWSLVVLHDTSRSHAANGLSSFLDALEQRHIEVVQEFPSDCVLMRSGQPTEALGTVMQMKRPDEGHPAQPVALSTASADPNPASAYKRNL